MEQIVCSMSALSVALLFYSWRDYYGSVRRRQQILRDRIAYMLWVMATGATD